MDGQLLLEPFISQPISKSFTVTDLCNHSKRVKPGDLFFAYPGTHMDGRAFIAEVLEKEPAAIVVEARELEKFALPKTDVPIIPIDGLNEKLGDIASKFFGEPSKQMVINGITGTNGKTTISHLISSALNQLGIKSAQIGTLGVIAPDYNQELNVTTPDSIQLHRTLAELLSLGVKTVSMEVSSHALEQFRTKGVDFDAAVFTNLTPDHLDYHQTMEAYGQAKLKLFKNKGLKYVVLNDEDAFTKTILASLKTDIETVLYTTKQTISASYFTKPMMVTTDAQQYSLNGIDADILTPWGQAKLKSKLIGHFNLSNLLAALSVLCLQGVSQSDALRALSKVLPVKGRMQCFGGVSHPQVIIDYAHTPDALKNALIAARANCKRTLWCVFGCGGNRDIDKRKLMGEVAAKYADKVVITNDNPRNEPPEDIIKDIMEGINLEKTKGIFVEEDRKRAIAHAIENALSFDVILVAGKGHEATQTINHQQIPFSDIQTVKQLLGEIA